MSHGDELYSGKDYLSKFDPAVFLREFYAGNVNRHRLRCFHDTFSILPPNLEVLDYGSGPCLVGTISAATKASKIILSDYSDVNCRTLRQWLIKDPTSFDWSPHFSYVVQELEGKKEQEVSKRQDLVRSLVDNVVHCDITKDPPIEQGYNNLYDVVISSFVLEVVAQTIDEYGLLVSRLGKLVKPGGLLLIYGVEHRNFYTVGNVTFWEISINADNTVAAMKDAGFNNIHVEKATLTMQSEKIKNYAFVKGTYVQ